MDDRNVKIDSLISTLDRQRKMIKEMTYVCPEVQVIIDKIGDDIKNGIYTNFVLMKSDYFKIIQLKQPRLQKKGIYIIWEQPIIIDDSIKNNFELVEDYKGCKNIYDYARYLSELRNLNVIKPYREYARNGQEIKMKNIDEKTITLGQLKCMAELFTHAMREINPDCDFVKDIDKFVKQIEDYIIAKGE
jgi:hypothetical protein